MGSAFICLVDNSLTTIDGDYRPTRIACIQDAVECVTRIATTRDQVSSVGFAAGAGRVRVVASVGRNARGLRVALEKLQREGEFDLAKAVHCGKFALMHAHKDIVQRRMLIFCASRARLPPDAASIAVLAKEIRDEGYTCDVITFGLDEKTAAGLKMFVEALGDAGRFFTWEPRFQTLTEFVEHSVLSGMPAPPPAAEDEQLQAALERSRRDAGKAPPLKAPGGDEDEELQRAIALSLETAGMKPSVTPAPSPQKPAPVETETPSAPSPSGSPSGNRVFDESARKAIFQAAKKVWSPTVLAESPPASVPPSAPPPPRPFRRPPDDDFEIEDEELANAVALSLGDLAPQPGDNVGADDEEDEELREAVRLSLEAAALEAGASPQTAENLQQVANTPGAAQELLDSLHPRNPDDPKGPDKKT